MKIRFTIDQRAERKEGFPVLLYVYKSPKDKATRAIGYYSTIENWDFERNEPKETHPDFYAIIEIIYKMRLNKREVYKKNDLSAKQIANYLLGKSGVIYDFWRERTAEFKKNKSSKGSVGRGTWGNYQVYLNFMEREYPGLKYDNITRAFLMRFKAEGGSDSCIKILRSVYREAIKRGVYVPDTHTNPFSGVMGKKKRTADKYLDLNEMKVIFQNPSENKFYKYFWLCFYLGGLDFIDVASMRKTNVRKSRVCFTRFKGNTSEEINNKIFPEAWAIIDTLKEDNGEFLLNIHRFKYEFHRRTYTEWIREYFQSLGIHRYVDSKTPRYTFINLGKQLFLNRDVVMEITGHARNDVHSIYEGGFPDQVQDGIHRQIIDAVMAPSGETIEDHP